MNLEHSQLDPAPRVKLEPAGRRAWAYERGLLWAIDLEREALSLAGIEPRLPAILGVASSADAGMLARAMGLPAEDPVLHRFATGRRCFMARVGDQIAAYCWVSQAPECIGELEHEIQVPPDEAYIWDCATLPDFRKKGLYSALLRNILITLKEEGLQRAWIGSSLDNRPSLRAFARAGFRPTVALFYLRLFQFSFLRVKADRDASSLHVAAARQRIAQPGERTWGPYLFKLARPVRLPTCAQS